MIGLPTYKRPHNLMRFIAAYGITKATEHVLVLIDDTDNSYDNVVMPNNFSVMIIKSGSTAAQRANIPFECFPNEPYYAIMGDDIVPHTLHWDKILRERAGDWKIAYPDDGIMGRKLATQPFIGGELVRAQGYVEEPLMEDAYADNCRMDIGRALHLLDYVDEVKFEHLHYINGKAALDETYAKQKKSSEKYEWWKVNKMQNEIERLKNVIRKNKQTFK